MAVRVPVLHAPGPKGQLYERYKLSQFQMMAGMNICSAAIAGLSLVQGKMDLAH